LTELLEPIRQAAQGDPARAGAAARGQAAAQALAEQLPLVHRTHWPGQPRDWREILRSRRIAPATNERAMEAACGLSTGAFFFLGAAAYHKGSVAFVLDPRAVDSGATFTPFDTGAVSCERAAPEPRPAAWTDPEHRARFVSEHRGAAGDLAGFAATYVAAHFRRSADYVSHPQVSSPDFPAYHGLKTDDGDRRAWTIEVQVPTVVVLTPAALRHLVVGRLALWEDVPAEFQGRVAVAAAPRDEDGDVAATVGRLILEDIGGAA
jgi:hypothetical protein